MDEQINSGYRLRRRVCIVRGSLKRLKNVALAQTQASRPARLIGSNYTLFTLLISITTLATSKRAAIACAALALSRAPAQVTENCRSRKGYGK